jgi:CDP-diacylglycerol--glycerol-3-phosphate 3-phosphatidyltransferase
MEASSLTVSTSRTPARVWLAANANIPNALTAMRAVILPVIFFMFFRREIVLALWLSIISAVTDILDGFVARALNQKTAFGKWFDSIMDKVSNLSQLAVCLFFPVAVYGWISAARAVFVVGVAAEIILALSRNDSFKTRWGFIKNDSAQWPGKVKAWLQNIAIGFFYLSFMVVADPSLSALRFGEAKILLYGAVFFTFISVAFRLDKQVWRERIATWFHNRTFKR